MKIHLCLTNPLGIPVLLRKVTLIWTHEGVNSECEEVQLSLCELLVMIFILPLYRILMILVPFVKFKKVLKLILLVTTRSVNR